MNNAQTIILRARNHELGRSTQDSNKGMIKEKREEEKRYMVEESSRKGVSVMKKIEEWRFR